MRGLRPELRAPPPALGPTFILLFFVGLFFFGWFFRCNNPVDCFLTCKLPRTPRPVSLSLTSTSFLCPCVVPRSQPGLGVPAQVLLVLGHAAPSQCPWVQWPRLISFPSLFLVQLLVLEVFRRRNSNTKQMPFSDRKQATVYGPAFPFSPVSLFL